MFATSKPRILHDPPDFRPIGSAGAALHGVRRRGPLEMFDDTADGLKAGGAVIVWLETIRKGRLMALRLLLTMIRKHIKRR